MKKIAEGYKALVPAILAATSVTAQWIASGKLDGAELRTIAAGALVTFMVWLVPNVPAAPPVAGDPDVPAVY